MVMEENIRQGQDQWAERIVSRDRKCQLCDTKENLEAHHKDGNPQNNSLENGVALCHEHNIMMERILANPDKFLPRELTYIGIHRSLADLRRKFKVSVANNSQSPMELSLLRDTVEQLVTSLHNMKQLNNQQGQLSTTGQRYYHMMTKIEKDRDNRIEEAIQESTYMGFECGLALGIDYGIDTLKMAVHIPGNFTAWFNANENRVETIRKEILQVHGFLAKETHYQLMSEPLIDLTTGKLLEPHK